MDGADAYMSMAKARHFDGAEMDLDLRFDMDSLNYYIHGQYPQQYGMINSGDVEPKDGITGELYQAGLI